MLQLLGIARAAAEAAASEDMKISRTKAQLGSLMHPSARLPTTTYKAGGFASSLGKGPLCRERCWVSRAVLQSHLLFPLLGKALATSHSKARNRLSLNCDLKVY